MTKTSVPRAAVWQAVPPIVSVLITTVYNMAEAVSVVFSWMAAFQAVGDTFGVGSGNVMSRQMGPWSGIRPTAPPYWGGGAFAIGLLFSIRMLFCTEYCPQYEAGKRVPLHLFLT